MIHQKQSGLSLVWTYLLMACGVALFMFGGGFYRFMWTQHDLISPVSLLDSRELGSEKIETETNLESIEVMGGTPTQRPTGPTPAPTVAPAKDYSCVHSTAWLVNTQGVYNSLYSSTVDVTSSGFVNATLATTGWKATFTGIPYYDHVLTQTEINTLNARPKAATDFVYGHTTAVAGTFYNFGDNIGFTTSKCVDGFWPPGPGCPIAYSGTYTFPVYPSPEYKSGGCYIPYHIGFYVNGVPFWSWSDATSYNDAGVWNCLAMEFEQYDMDVCSGHSGSNTYHHHSVSPCLMTQLNDTGDSHSPVHGFALDGYPIYGPYQAANTLAQSCWQARDYSSAATGCAGGERTCTLVNSYNYKLGTVTAASAGPPLNSTVQTQSKNTISSDSGIYYEDMFYNLTCTQQSIAHLDSYNGHTHGSYGYHYHLTMTSAGVPTFPYTMGPKFYGCQTSGSCQTGISSGSGTSICTNTYTQKSGACTAFKGTTGIPYPTAIPTNAPVTRKPTMKPSSSVPTRSQNPTKVPTAKPTLLPTGMPIIDPTTLPTASPTYLPTEVPTAVPTFVPTENPTFDPTFLPSDLPTHVPTAVPTAVPTEVPTFDPTFIPTELPTAVPTAVPTEVPTAVPTAVPTTVPTYVPTDLPSDLPSVLPSAAPTISTLSPTPLPGFIPTRKPSPGSTMLTVKPSTMPTTVQPPSISLSPTVALKPIKVTKPPASSSVDRPEDPTAVPTVKPKKTRSPTVKPRKSHKPTFAHTHKPNHVKRTHKPTKKGKSGKA